MGAYAYSGQASRPVGTESVDGGATRVTFVMSHWKDLFAEIVATDVCCGCAACVLVCPHHVLDYDFSMAKPFQTDEKRPDGCSHGDKGCELCALACPRLDHEAGIWRWNWPQLEEQL